MKTCHRCGAPVARDSVGARDTCKRCRAYLHCCRNCEFYEPGAHNDCREPNAEVVADKEQGNFCDYFRYASGAPTAAARSDDARGELERLFRKR